MPVILLGSPTQRDEIMKKVLKFFTPNEPMSWRTSLFFVASYLIIWLAVWSSTRPDIFPSPIEVIQAFPELWTSGGLGQEIIASLVVNWESLLLSAAISLPLAYASRIPALNPISQAVAKLRFVSPAVFYLMFVYALTGGHQVKVAMLTLGETVFLLTTMIGVVHSVPNYVLDDCRTLKMDEWKTMWYAVVRGTLPQAIDAIRDNEAMGWSMLMMVEGVVRSEGGVGVMILNQEKHFNFASVYAIAIAIVVLGMVQDYVIGLFKQVVCPYAD